MVNIKTNRNSTNQTSIQNTEMTNNNIKKIKKKKKEAGRNRSPSVWQAQTCGRVKSIKQ